MGGGELLLKGEIEGPHKLLLHQFWVVFSFLKNGENASHNQDENNFALGFTFSRAGSALLHQYRLTNRIE